MKLGDCFPLFYFMGSFEPSKFPRLKTEQLGNRSIGRTADSDSVNLGSNPSSPTR